MNIQEAIDQIQLNRTRYQLEHFAVGQHHTPEMQYRQLLSEADVLLGTIKETELRIRKIEAEAEELRETGKKSDAIEAEIKELALTSLHRHIKNARRELAILEELFETYPKYTIQDIEAAQEDYWHDRLLRTAHFQALGGAVNWAQLEAIWQAGILPEMLQMDLLTEINKLQAPNVAGQLNKSA